MSAAQWARVIAASLGAAEAVGVLRAKATAWDFLTAQGEVPGATLAEYLDAAGAFAYEETGVDLAATPRDGKGEE